MFSSGGGKKLKLSAATLERGRAWMDTFESEAAGQDTGKPGCSAAAGGFETAHSAVTASAVPCGALGAAPPPLRALHKPAGPGGFKRPRPTCGVGGPNCGGAAEASAPPPDAGSVAALGAGPAQPQARATAGGSGTTPRIASGVMSPAMGAPRVPPAGPAHPPQQQAAATTPARPREGLPAARTPQMNPSGQRGGFRAPRQAPKPPTPAAPAAPPTPGPLRGLVAQQRPLALPGAQAPPEVCMCAVVAPLRARPCPSCCPACGGRLEDSRSIQVMHALGCRHDGAGSVRLPPRGGVAVGAR